jgi:hypothetical protein
LISFILSSSASSRASSSLLTGPFYLLLILNPCSTIFSSFLFFSLHFILFLFAIGREECKAATVMKQQRHGCEGAARAAAWLGTAAACSGIEICKLGLVAARSKGSAVW